MTALANITSDERAAQAASILEDSDIQLEPDVRRSIENELIEYVGRKRQQQEDAAKAAEELKRFNPETATIEEKRAYAREKLIEQIDEGEQNMGAFMVDAVSGALQLPTRAADFSLMIMDAALDEEREGVAPMKVALKAGRANLQEKLDAFDAVAAFNRTEYFPAADVSPAAGQFMGEMVMFAPLGFVGTTTKGGGFLSNLFANTMLGAGMGGMMGAEGAMRMDDIKMDMLLGGGFGAGATFMFSGLPGMRKKFADEYVKELDTQAGKVAAALEQDIRAMTGRDDFAFTLAQMADQNPYLVGAQYGAAGSYTLKQQNRNIEILADYLQKDATMGPDKLVKNINLLITDAAATMRKTANDNYELAFEKLVEESGGDLVLDGKQYLEALRQESNSMVEPLLMGGALPKNWETHVNMVEELVEPFAMRANAKGDVFEIVKRDTGEVLATKGNADEVRAIVLDMNNKKGGLEVAELQKILKGHNRILSGQTSTFEAARSGSLDATIKHINAELHKSMKATTNPAVKQLDNVQKAYAYDMQNIRTLQNSTLGRIFGVDDATQLLDNPEKAIATLLKMKDPQAMAKVRDTMNAVAPVYLQELKDTLLNRAVVGARRGNASIHDTEVDLDALANALTGMPGPGQKSVTGQKFLGLFEPEEQTHLVKTANALRTLKSTYLSKATRDTQGMMADVGINVASLNKAFVTRWLVRLSTQSKSFERLLVDPKQRQAMITLSEKGIESSAGKTAFMYLFINEGVGSARDRMEEEGEADLRKRQAEAGTAQQRQAPR